MSVVTMDGNGRVLLPRDVRESLRLDPGDALFLTQDGRFITLTKASNPFDRLAAHAIAEYYAGETVSLEDAVSAPDSERDTGR